MAAPARVSDRTDRPGDDRRQCPFRLAPLYMDDARATLSRKDRCSPRTLIKRDCRLTKLKSSQHCLTLKISVA
jgi:hypothetical protein